MNAKAWFYGQSFNGGTRASVAARCTGCGRQTALCDESQRCFECCALRCSCAENAPQDLPPDYSDLEDEGNRPRNEATDFQREVIARLWQ